MGLTLLLIVSSISLQAEEASTVSAELVLFSERIEPASNIEFAVTLNMKDDWHTYWQNPGEAGMATDFDWTLPPGFKITYTREPVPKRHVEDGITTFIHERTATYLFGVETPEIIPDTLQIQLKVDWLECKSICRAGSAELALSAPTNTKLPIPSKRDRINTTISLPIKTELNPGSVKINRGVVSLDFAQVTESDWPISEIDFFPSEELIFDVSQKPSLKSRFLRSPVLKIPLLEDTPPPERLRGVLRIITKSEDKAQLFNLIIDEPIQP